MLIDSSRQLHTLAALYVDFYAISPRAEGEASMRRRRFDDASC